MSFAKDLRASVLQAAMQGKLTEQCEIDTPVSRLLQETQHATDVLKQEYKLKRSKPLLEIDHEPFDIPDSWEWTRLGTACTVIFSGKSPTYSPNTTRYVCIGQKNNQEYGIDFNGEKYLTLDFAEKIPAYQFLQTNDVLLNTLGTGTVGRSGIWNNEKENVCTDGHLMVMRTVYPETARYLLYILRMRRTEIENSADGSTNQKFLKLEDVRNYLIPLPPIEEQKRIVQRIDEIMTLIDELEAIENELTRLKAAFPGDMKAAVLQAAMQGKLTEQLETDGSVDELLAQINIEREQLIKEGKIKKPKAHQNNNFVALDDVPFDIPSNWKWITFEDVGYFISGYSPESEYIGKTNGVPYFKVGDMNTVGNELYLNVTNNFVAKEKCRLFPKNTIVYPKNGGAIFTNKRRLLAQDSIVDLNTGGFCCLNQNCLKYMFLFLQTLDFSHYYKGSALPTLDMDKIKQIPIPLPPIEEQQRIVGKLETILPLIEGI